MTLSYTWQTIMQSATLHRWLLAKFAKQPGAICGHGTSECLRQTINSVRQLSACAQHIPCTAPASNRLKEAADSAWPCTKASRASKDHITTSAGHEMLQSPRQGTTCSGRGEPNAVHLAAHAGRTQAVRSNARAVSAAAPQD